MALGRALLALCGATATLAAPRAGTQPHILHVIVGTRRHPAGSASSQLRLANKRLPKAGPSSAFDASSAFQRHRGFPRLRLA